MNESTRYAIVSLLGIVAVAMVAIGIVVALGLWVHGVFVQRDACAAACHPSLSMEIQDGDLGERICHCATPTGWERADSREVSTP